MAYRSKSARMKGFLKAAGRQWTPFNPVTITDEMREQHPHLKNCSSMWANSRYKVDVFECSSEIGGIVQLVIGRHLPGSDPIPWDDLQRVVRDLYGHEVTAVEVYPPTSLTWRVGRELRVLWVCPTTWMPPFGLHIPGAWGE